MIKYPLTFKVSSNEKQGETTFQGNAEDFPPIALAVPQAFGGPGGGYSPEDLFSLAVIGCITATFRVFAQKIGFAYEGLDADATLTIDRNAQGVPELQKLEVNLTFKGAADQEKAKALLEESKKYCLVSNAIKCETSFNLQIQS